MSRSNPTELAVNPATRFFSWNGADGHFFYFDKNKGEKGENVILKLPFTFLTLDVLSTIKGYSDADQTGYWSNEIRDLSKEKFNVRAKKHTVELGLYSEIKGNLAKIGADYTQSVYIAYKNESGELVIANVNMKGAALSAWIEFRNKHRKAIEEEKAVTVKSFTTGKKGAVTYKMPTFELLDVTPETNAKAVELDKVLQAYLKDYFARNNKEVEETKAAEEVVKAQVEAAHENIFGGEQDPFAEFEPATEVDNSGAAIFPPKTEKATQPEEEDDQMPF